MTLEDIEKRLEEIGIDGFVEAYSKISLNPKELIVFICIEGKEDLLGDNCDKFWNFFKKYSKNNSNKYFLTQIPPNLHLEITYTNGELTFKGDKDIKDTWFYTFLKDGLLDFFNNIYDEI